MKWEYKNCTLEEVLSTPAEKLAASPGALQRQRAFDDWSGDNDEAFALQLESVDLALMTCFSQFLLVGSCLSWADLVSWNIEGSEKAEALILGFRLLIVLFSRRVKDALGGGGSLF